ncbi:MAG: YsnF/AvaK domain-containing protein, partial [Actinomycetia bacterium]|nr:YsnF/AvaK domain-containing protein [Actinomycetes bacterium]
DRDVTDRDRTDRGVTDDTETMTRSEEQLRVGTEQQETGRARLRKYTTTEEETVTVPVEKERLVVEREPIEGDGTRSAGSIGDGDGDVEEDIVLREERPVVDKETVDVENVRVGKETVTDDQTVTEEVRKEHIDVDGEGLDEQGNPRNTR